MKVVDWTSIKSVLDETITLSEPEREAFFDRAKIDRYTRSEVESLLSHEKNAVGFMSVTAGSFVSELLLDKSKNGYTSLVGQTIGIYEIVGELGLGGMGAVYLGERRDTKFNQRVAIKLLKREMNVGKVRESFRREIAIQSKLVHPNIAAVLDTGTTGEGIPYVIMEYIEGQPIDAYCNANRLSLAERLKLFNKACEAVAFAHQNLIVHRDIKPTNILVTADGVPKLLDFGISKLLDESSAGDVESLTLVGAMTTAYASPEQARGEKVSTTTDIYSLGVVLFKLLTGQFPYDLTGKVNGKILKEITESEALAPSLAGTEPNISPSRLRGDLDNIVLKSLRKIPGERYGTVEQFTGDIWRHLDGLPISARAATRSYRLAKFYRRNKLPVVAGLLIFLSLFTGMTMSLWQANIARAQANSASEARNAAEREAEHSRSEQAKSEKISKFVAKLISYANSAWYGEGAKFGGDARVVDALVDLSDKIDVEFADDPDIAAELHHKFGEAIGWADPSGADKEFAELLRTTQKAHLLRALELRVQFYGEWHELVAKDLFYTYNIIGKNAAEKAFLLDRSLNMMRSSNPNNLNYPYIIEAYTSRMIMPEADESPEAYLQAVTPPTTENKYQIAERYLRESLPVFRLHYKEDNRAIFGAECKLALALAMQEKWVDFTEHYTICTQAQTKMNDPAPLNGMKKIIGEIEKRRGP